MILEAQPLLSSQDFTLLFLSWLGGCFIFCALAMAWSWWRMREGKKKIYRLKDFL